MRPEIEDVIKEADRIMAYAADAPSEKATVLATNRAVIAMLGALLQEIAMLREDLAEK